MESETAYSLLNVPRTASSEEILLAYRKQSLKFHPQRFDSSDSFIHVHFKKLAEAYETLIDPQKRLEYDRQLILRKLKGIRVRKDSLASRPTPYDNNYPPKRPGSCAPAIETTQFIQRSQPNLPIQINSSTSAIPSQLSNTRPDRHSLRPSSSTQAYQNLNANLERQPLFNRTRPRADSFSSTSIRPSFSSPSKSYSPVTAAPRGYYPSPTAPSSAAATSPHRFLNPSNPSTSSHLDQYHPITSTLQTPKPRLASNSISSIYQYHHFSHQRPHYQ